MFRPCIDLHEGKVKRSSAGHSPMIGFAADELCFGAASTWYAELYRGDGLRGGHV